MLKELLKVFTQEYRNETEYRQFMKANISIFKLKSSSEIESVDNKVSRLRETKLNKNLNGEVLP